MKTVAVENEDHTGCIMRNDAQTERLLNLGESLRLWKLRCFVTKQLLDHMNKLYPTWFINDLEDEIQMRMIELDRSQGVR